MIDRGHDLALATQADLLGIARSSVYPEPQPVPVADLAVMRRIDELYLDHPFPGSRMMPDMLVNVRYRAGVVSVNMRKNCGTPTSDVSLFG
jgi:hypothetical protein